MEGVEQGDLDFQQRMLQGVSRTFALTIPQLPAGLCDVVGNAYLLCRIADTIEDDVALVIEQKLQYSNMFTEVVAGAVDADLFAAQLHPLLSPRTLATERELIGNTVRVIKLTQTFRPRQRAALERCVRIMSRGMAEFQLNASLNGLDDLAHLDRYCYHVAGVVGEMLTELFCDYAPDIDAQRDGMMKLAVSFGQGLQMTNILKDIWEDYARGACWLPRSVFDQVGFDLTTLTNLTEGRDASFADGLAELIGIARDHLTNALHYTLLVPERERGIRRFCLWALGMAVLTLRKINANRNFTRGRDVKISRRSVKSTILVTNLAVGHDASLRWLFDGFTKTLPVAAARGRILTT